MIVNISVLFFLLSNILSSRSGLKPGEYLIIILSHRETKKEQILVVEVRARDAILERDTSWNRYWKMRAKFEASSFLNNNYQIEKIILESRSEISYFSYEVR